MRSRRGRPMLDRETVQERIGEYGWEIPAGIKYRGVNEVHTVRCTSCGHITEKVLNNIVYRGEVCTVPHEPCLSPADTITAGVAPDFLKEAIKTEIKPLMDMLEKQQETILNTAIQRDDLITKFNKLLAGTISRKGYLTYNRQMTTEEWFEISDTIARDLVDRLDPENKTLLLSNYEYHRSKNPNTKPEKVLLMIMGKTQLFKSLELIQLIKLTL